MKVEGDTSGLVTHKIGTNFVVLMAVKQFYTDARIRILVLKNVINVTIKIHLQPV